ncbi:MAG TPA: 4-aminobutyrate--2-oxoglutarate transaminase [Povalibacter sp.]|nr:4-aminobutyrate--2-oxoglutarate transaminase [Povalibacter sp.]
MNAASPDLHDVVPRGVATKGVFAHRAENSELWTADGTRYIDFAAGIAVCNTGHRHPRVMAAAMEQLSQFTHTCFHVAPYEGYLRLAQKLNVSTPGDFPKKTMLVSTGAEAVENAIKIARYATRRQAVIAFRGGFHGRTSLGMALTGKTSPYKKGFGPPSPGIFHASFPNYAENINSAEALASLDQLFRTDIDPAEVAALLVEPVQGEGGFNVAPAEFLRELRTIADQHGIALVVDEVQTGMGRTGKLFAIEYAGVVPDLIVSAKGLGGGFPLAAVTGRASLMDAPHVGALGGTFAGNPVSVAAALAVFEVIESERLCDRALEIGKTIQARLRSCAETVPAIGDVRGLGAMQAIELVKNKETREPDAGLAAAIAARAQASGLIVLTCGAFGNVIRLLTPLTIPTPVLAEGLDILARCISEAHASAAAGNGRAA